MGNTQLERIANRARGADVGWGTTKAAGLSALLLMSLTGCGKVSEVLHSSPGADGGLPSDTGGGSSLGGADGGPVVRTGEQGDGAAPASPQPDLHTAETRAVLKKYCAPLETTSCAVYWTGAQNLSAADCEKTEEISAYPLARIGCWEAWDAAAECVVALGPPCDCTTTTQCALRQFIDEANDVNGNPPAGPCYAERKAIEDCVANHAPAGLEPSENYVYGSRTTCRHYSGTQDSITPLPPCHADCDPPTGRHDAFATDCVGPPGGPYSCGCTVNGKALADDAAGAAPTTLLADNCHAVAQAMANGWCTGGLDCCYAWTSNVQGKDVYNCRCTSDPPGKPHYDYPGAPTTCAGLIATQTGATAVSSCPWYEPVEAGGRVSLYPDGT